MTHHELALAGDLGGTNARLRIDEGSKTLFERHYPSREFSSLSPIVARFLEAWGKTPPSRACFAVAGPVAQDGRSAKVTNLDWVLETDQLRDSLGIERVGLVNDFAAVGHGISALGPEQLHILQRGWPDAAAPRAVLGAGTGLGQALILPRGEDWEVIATEGSHADFAPQGEQQIALLGFLEQQYGHVSYDRVVSGNGLVQIYRLLAMQWCTPPSVDWRSPQAAAEISRLALAEDDRLAEASLDLFVRLYGAQAGNLALTSMARGGVYIAGGIAPKILAKLDSGLFMESFLAKGRMRDLMTRFPVQVVLEPQTGLLGAMHLARRL